MQLSLCPFAISLAVITLLERLMPQAARRTVLSAARALALALLAALITSAASAATEGAGTAPGGARPPAAPTLGVPIVRTAAAPGQVLQMSDLAGNVEVVRF